MLKEKGNLDFEHTLFVTGYKKQLLLIKLIHKVKFYENCF
ncbi:MULTISPECIES: hypothetical protein [Acinetobacter]|uniref:Uncharacterized protein n=1 Tax=Acinetobacter geminorum TaxID=2730922 RepID=A0ABT8ZEI1_9GAMM|nr:MULTISPECIES: hypothetical protein [Acinetobacter]MBJ9938068.1 hypothetical protein [Acinetobacter pittii]MCU4362994.1 hypothetical protein [Acinetobacter sp. WU_MDCI_Abxc22]MCU4528270.1 hypothetical protein [Acinetobacter pittii]MDO7362766.1 hypothetical protein [Acinetobacter geminorum]